MFFPRSYSQQQASFPEDSEVSIILFFNHPSFDHKTRVTVPSPASFTEWPDLVFKLTHASSFTKKWLQLWRPLWKKTQ